MNEQTTTSLEETMTERSAAMPAPFVDPEVLIGRARATQRRRTAFVAGGGVAATIAAVAVGLALPSGPAPQQPAGRPTPSVSAAERVLTIDEALTIDQTSRVNAVHAWATALPPGPPVQRELGYRAWRENGRIVVEVGSRQTVLEDDVTMLVNPVKVADGWLFLATDDSGELPTRVLHVGDGGEVTVVARATVVWQAVAGPGGRQFVVVSGDPGADGVLRNTATFHAVGSPDVRRLDLQGWQEPRIATWSGDVVSIPAPPGAETALRSYDLRRGSWQDVRAFANDAAGSSVRPLALLGAEGGDTSRALVAVERPDGSGCIHVLAGSEVESKELLCADLAADLQARVSPGATYAILGRSPLGRVNVDRPARVINLVTGADAPGIPSELLDVGAPNLYWEKEHVLIGQANRVTPVHRSEALFRWDVDAGSGQSLEWDLAASPLPRFDPTSDDAPAVTWHGP